MDVTTGKSDQMHGYYYEIYQFTGTLLNFGWKYLESHFFLIVWTFLRSAFEIPP